MNDIIYRQDAIRKYCYESCGCDAECGTEGCPMTFDRDGAEECYFIRFLKEVPSAQSDAIPLEWIDKHLKWLDNCDNDFAQLAKVGIRAMVEIWKKEKTQ